jgi:hypothetical protein
VRHVSEEHDFTQKSFSSGNETFFSKLCCPESIKSPQVPPIQFANLLTISLLSIAAWIFEGGSAGYSIDFKEIKSMR